MTESVTEPLTEPLPQVSADIADDPPTLRGLLRATGSIDLQLGDPLEAGEVASTDETHTSRAPQPGSLSTADRTTSGHQSRESGSFRSRDSVHSAAPAARRMIKRRLERRAVPRTSGHPERRLAHDAESALSTEQRRLGAVLRRPAPAVSDGEFGTARRPEPASLPATRPIDGIVPGGRPDHPTRTGQEQPITSRSVAPQDKDEPAVPRDLSSVAARGLARGRSGALGSASEMMLVTASALVVRETADLEIPRAPTTGGLLRRLYTRIASFLKRTRKRLFGQD